MTQFNKDLKLDSYDYFLPPELIAKNQLQNRHDSKLLVYKAKSDAVFHDHFKNIPRYLNENHLLVMNESKVFPCRLMGKKKTGGKCELFLLSYVDDDGIYRAMVKTTSKKKIGEEYFFDGGLKATLKEDHGDGSFGVRFNKDNMEKVLDEIGMVPIPPYIRDGMSDDVDKENYQTIYAKNKGSVAAPTAGLHFTGHVFKGLEDKNIGRAFVTLHVGPGTFAPVKAENIDDHKMHFELYFIGKENLEKIHSGKDIIAVGTTSLRVLESSYEKDISPDEVYATDIFLYPGKEVKSIKGLITNFHLPKSSLLMLVSSLIGREKTLELYKTAIENQYRFYSYGDSMLILLEE